MVSAAMLAPASASISTPVRCSTATSHTTRSPPRRVATAIFTLVSGSGWQKGISSWVRLAASTPAMMAVSNTGPFLVRWPLRTSSRATFAGSFTSASALASRRVTSLPPTSTMVGRFAASRCVRRVARLAIGKTGASAADVVHLDLGVVVAAGAQDHALLAVAVLALRPGAAQDAQKFVIVGAGAQGPAQIGAMLCKEAGVEHAIRGQARARARPAKWLRHRRDES